MPSGAVHTIFASEAKQSIATPRRKLDCFVAFAPRNDVASISDMPPRIPRRDAPGLCINCPRQQRAQGMPGARCTRSLACKVKKHTSVVTTGSPEQPGIPCAMVYGLFRALLGDRACLPPSPAEMVSANLTPASRRQDHTTSPSAASTIRQACCHVHRIPPHVDDVRNAPLPGQDGESRRTDLPDGLSGIFFQEGLDRF
jgi:hypothetical protein